MTEPETLSYTISHFNNQPAGTQMRHLIFEKYAAVAKPWLISDSIINYFEVNKTAARNGAKNWWESQGSYTPEASGPAAQQLDGGKFNSYKEYAVLEAGRNKVAT